MQRFVFMVSGVAAIFCVMTLGTIEYINPNSIGRSFFLFNVPIIVMWVIAAVPSILGYTPDWWVKLLGDRLSSKISSELQNDSKWPQNTTQSNNFLRLLASAFLIGVVAGIIFS